jgi:16S rRNA pseudouridine516 synthase
VLVALHKPVGFVVSHATSEGPSVFSLLPAPWSGRLPQVVAVGRLDKDSSGLLLVTDDHALVHRLGSPRRHVAKRYRITLAERPADPQTWVDRFAAGTLVLRGEDRPCRPAALAFDPTEPRRAEVVLTEGRHRQLRRMVAACGGEVVALHRTAIGGVLLGDLAPGAWRDVDPQELDGGPPTVVAAGADGPDTSGPSGGTVVPDATVDGTGDDGSGASSDA